MGYFKCHKLVSIPWKILGFQQINIVFICSVIKLRQRQVILTLCYIQFQKTLSNDKNFGTCFEKLKQRLFCNNIFQLRKITNIFPSTDNTHFWHKDKKHAEKTTEDNSQCNECEGSILLRCYHHGHRCSD